MIVQQAQYCALWWPIYRNTSKTPGNNVTGNVVVPTGTDSGNVSLDSVAGNALVTAYTNAANNLLQTVQNTINNSLNQAANTNIYLLNNTLQRVNALFGPNYFNSSVSGQTNVYSGSGAVSSSFFNTMVNDVENFAGSLLTGLITGT